MAARLWVLLATAALMPATALAQPGGHPTKRDVEALVARAVPPLHACLARSGIRASAGSVTIVVEFDPSGGFPVLHEIRTPPGSPQELCVGEAMAELTSPPYRAAPMSVECQLPLGPGRAVVCGLVRATPSPPSPPPVQSSPPPPPAAVTPPPPAAEGPLSRSEVAAAMEGVNPRMVACGSLVTPPPTVTVRLRIDGRGRASFVDATPSPPLPVVECFREAATGMQLRATGLEAITVAYPFSFR